MGEVREPEEVGEGKMVKKPTNQLRNTEKKF